jgi:hypothetical protein
VDQGRRRSERRAPDDRLRRNDHRRRRALRPGTDRCRRASARIKAPGELPVVADVPRSLAVRVGRADSIEIPLKSTVTVTGRFVERGTGKPVSGITVKDSAPTRPSRSQRGAATGRARARSRSRPATSR